MVSFVTSGYMLRLNRARLPRMQCWLRVRQLYYCAGPVALCEDADWGQVVR